jgi:threonine dehydratase
VASGVGYVLRELCPLTQVIAVQPVGAPAMALSWRKREVVTTSTTWFSSTTPTGRYAACSSDDDSAADV